ncbi:MAG: hypothetical protein LBR47_00430 [Spirochaetaceae bacterium]|jgi:hypothetical protein|nr:hypothetical protein [Spirochaetaceae bacterium]
MLSGGASSAGGALMQVYPGMAAVNPALPADIQQVTLDMSGLFLADLRTGSDFGGGFGLGALFPSRWGVAAFNLQGTFADSFEDMPLGKVFSLYGGFSKDLSDTVYVGAGLSTAMGHTWGGFRWGLELSLGFWNRIGTVGFIRDFRWGLTLNGMGKPYSGSEGIMDGFPAMFTLRGGIAGTLVSLEKFKLGMSADISLPVIIENAILDLGLEARFSDRVIVRSGWTVNVRECMRGDMGLIPSLSVGMKFRTHIDLEILSRNELQQTDIIPAVAFKPLYNGITAFSGGVTAYLGMRDTEAPVINIWGDDE